jgi:hypothetical protein
MDQEHNDRELPQIKPITDAERLEIVLGYLRLISESKDSAVKIQPSSKEVANQNQL